jgi:hypothetical protein
VGVGGFVFVVFHCSASSFWAGLSQSCLSMQPVAALFSRFRFLDSGWTSRTGGAFQTDPVLGGAVDCLFHLLLLYCCHQLLPYDHRPCGTVAVLLPGLLLSEKVLFRIARCMNSHVTKVCSDRLTVAVVNCLSTSPVTLRRSSCVDWWNPWQM